MTLLGRGESLKWFDRLRMSAKGAIAGWSGKGFDFSSWKGRRFWGVDNSQIVTNETIFSVISRLSNTLSSLPVKLYKNYDVITDHESADILTNNPNENMSSFDLVNKLEVSRNEKGNGYAVIGRDIRMRVESIIPLDASYVTPFINADDQNLWYEARGADHTYYIHNMNMLHVKHITGTSRWAGICPIEVLKNTLEYDKAVQEFSLSEMQKKDSFILEYGSNVDAVKRQQIADNFKRFHKENGGCCSKNPVLILPTWRENISLPTHYLLSELHGLE